MAREKRLRIYIDIDGTILYDPPDGRGLDHLDLQLICDGREDFLVFAVEHCEPYWLSTDVRNYGDVLRSSGGSQPLAGDLGQEGVKIAAGEGPLSPDFSLKVWPKAA